MLQVSLLAMLRQDRANRGPGGSLQFDIFHVSSSGWFHIRSAEQRSQGKMCGLFHSNQNGFNGCLWWQKEVLVETSDFWSKPSTGRRMDRVRVVSILGTDILNRDAASAKVLCEGGVSLRQYIPPP